MVLDLLKGLLDYNLVAILANLRVFEENFHLKYSLNFATLDQPNTVYSNLIFSVSILIDHFDD